MDSSRNEEFCIYCYQGGGFKENGYHRQ
ncbi:MAG: hypothetical protein JW705_06255 [Methanosarcinaceae archaeon]|nr:hypothetical protein [Methanosarcinaceae archaeon]